MMAMRETATYTLDPESAHYPLAPVAIHGVAGIRALAADALVDGSTRSGLDDPVRLPERRAPGTGGGTFRGLYAPLLDAVRDLAEAEATPYEETLAALDSTRPDSGLSCHASRHTY